MQYKHWHLCLLLFLCFAIGETLHVGHEAKNKVPISKRCYHLSGSTTEGSLGEKQERLQRSASIVEAYANNSRFSWISTKSGLLLVRANTKDNSAIHISLSGFPVRKVEGIWIFGPFIHHTQTSNRTTVSKLKTGRANSVSNKWGGLRGSDALRLTHAFVKIRILYAIPYLCTNKQEGETTPMSARLLRQLWTYWRLHPMLGFGCAQLLPRSAGSPPHIFTRGSSRRFLYAACSTAYISNTLALQKRHLLQNCGAMCSGSLRSPLTRTCTWIIAAGQQARLGCLKNNMATQVVYNTQT